MFQGISTYVIYGGKIILMVVDIQKKKKIHSLFISLLVNPVDWD